VKLRHGLFFLAVALATGTPAFADKLPANIADGDRDSISLQGSSLKTLSWDSFEKGEFRIASHFAGKMGDSAKGDETSDIFSPLKFGRGRNDRDADWSELGSKHADSFDRDRDDRLCVVVATPEPSSATLLLFGFAVLGIIVFRRSSL